MVEENGVTRIFVDEEVWYTKIENKAQCTFCAAWITKPSLKRHQRSCPRNDQPSTSTFECDNCKRFFKRSDSFAIHKRRCVAKKASTQSVPCTYKECKIIFGGLSSLIEHLRYCHKAPLLDTQTLYFENENLFIEWKEKEEDRTFSYFIKRNFSLASRGMAKKYYYYCQRHGPARSHRKNKAENKTDRKRACGRIEKGGVCTAHMKATCLKDGSLTVVYHPTHSHPINPEDVKFHPLSSDSYRFIDARIAAGMSPSDIKRELDKRVAKKGGKDSKKTVTLKCIRERARARQKSTKCLQNGAELSLSPTDQENNDSFLSDSSSIEPCADEEQHKNNFEPFLFTAQSENNESFKSMLPALKPSANGDDLLAHGDNRQICKKRLQENVNKIILLLENDNLTDDMLNSLDVGVAKVLESVTSQ